MYPEKYQHYTDNELIQEYKLTRNNLFVGILYKRYAHLVLGLCIKYLKDKDEAQDAVMQIFEKLLSDLLKHQVEFFKSWLYTFSKNYCLMQIRQRQSKLRKEIELQENAGLFMETEPIGHPNHAEAKETRYTMLEMAIAELNNEQRICIEWFYLKDKSYQEVADLTGYSLNEVKSYIQNGKRNLKLKLEKNIGEQRST
ncbi:MAG: sigma-70 family RNA polymerase sigma factor [Bacteroidetes bacterium]|nr:sigma-70 family RNA polymerase sigma factor [Bacteroidota bacterium]